MADFHFIVVWKHSLHILAPRIGTAPRTPWRTQTRTQPRTTQKHRGSHPGVGLQDLAKFQPSPNTEVLHNKEFQNFGQIDPKIPLLKSGPFPSPCA